MSHFFYFINFHFLHAFSTCQTARKLDANLQLLCSCSQCHYDTRERWFGAGSSGEKSVGRPHLLSTSDYPLMGSSLALCASIIFAVHLPLTSVFYISVPLG